MERMKYLNMKECSEDKMLSNTISAFTPMDLEKKAIPELAPKELGVSYYIIGYFSFVIMFIPITIGMVFVPGISTNSSFYTYLFERKNHYTDYFSIGKYLYWMILCIAGFAFVNVVNLKNERGSPFKSRDDSYKDIKKMLITVSLLYFIAPTIFLRDQYDMQRGCSVNQVSTTDTTSLANSTKMSHLNESLSNNFNPSANSNVVSSQNWKNEDSALSFLGVHEAEICHTYTMWEVFIYNFFFVICYFVALNWTHFQKTPLKNISLNSDFVKKSGITEWIALIFTLVIIFGSLFYLLILYERSGILAFYLKMIFIECGSLGLITFIRRKTHSFHLHHYFWALLIVTVLGYQSLLITCFAGLASGIMVEGMCKWGFGPLWPRK